VNGSNLYDRDGMGWQQLKFISVVGSVHLAGGQVVGAPGVAISG
jgi:hypothetical protein